MNPYWNIELNSNATLICYTIKYNNIKGFWCRWAFATQYQTIYCWFINIQSVYSFTYWNLEITQKIILGNKPRWSLRIQYTIQTFTPSVLAERDFVRLNVNLSLFLSKLTGICWVDNGDCEHVCIPHMKVKECRCHLGYKLQIDGISCRSGKWKKCYLKKKSALKTKTKPPTQMYIKLGEFLNFLGWFKWSRVQVTSLVENVVAG